MNEPIKTCFQCKNWYYPSCTNGWDILEYRIKFPKLSYNQSNEDIFLLLEKNRLVPIINGQIFCKPNNCWVQKTHLKCHLFEEVDVHSKKYIMESFNSTYRSITSRIRSKDRAIFGYHKKTIYGNKRRWSKYGKNKSQN